MALAYLLCPTFQIENTAGKPATGGWLEVYVAGSRTKYYCASDFDGTLHPFRIPLDSLGSNIVLADDAGSYDVYVYNRYGGEMMSRYNVKPGSGGGIGSITSADGSIIITPTENGLDLRTNSKAPSILRATAQNLSGDGQFQFSELQRDGQDAVVDTNGRVMVNEGWWHYDATVRLRWPGDPNVNGTQSISLYTANASDSTSFDLSYAHSDTVQVNGEFKAANDGTQFILGVTGVQPGMTVELVDFGIHSIIGEGAGGKYNAGTGIDIDEPNRVISVDTDTIQEKLTPGNGITIDGNNEISVDTTVVATQADLATKQDVISDLSDIRAGAAAGATAVQDADYVHTDNNFTDADVTKLSGIEAGAEVNVQANWNESDSSSDSFILNKPTIPSGSQLVPSATPSDAGEVLTVDSNGDPTWAPAQAPISAGDGIDITNNVVSAKVDGTSVTFNANGELEATAAPQVQSDWAEDDPVDVSFIRNKPSQTSLVAGSNITIVDDAQNNTVTISAASVNVPVQDVTINNVSVVNAQGVAQIPRQVNADWNSSAGASEILNKPTIPPALSAGNGIDITNNVVSVDLDGASLTNGANGLSVTLPVPDTTVASQGDVLSVGQNGIEWTTPTVSANNVYRATSTTTFTDLWQAYHVDHKIVYYSEGNDGRAYYLQELKANDSSHVDGRATFVLFNRYSTGRIETYYCEKWLSSSTTLGSLSFTKQIIIPDNPGSHAGELVTPNSSGNMVYTTVSGLPASTVSDEGKLLTVNSSGNAEWATVSVPVIGTITL